jgi:outer membrane protein TolC
MRGRFALVFWSALSALATAEFAAKAAEPVAPPPADPPLADGASKEDAPVEKLSFDAAVARALARNPTALQAQAEVRRARAIVEQVRSASLPTLGASGVYTRLDSNRVAGGLVLQPESGFNLAATLAVPLVNVRGWVTWEQADDQVGVSEKAQKDVERALGVTTARAYLTVVAEKRLVETARIARDNAKAHYDFTHAQLAGGIGNQLDEARAAQELTADEVLIETQRALLVHAREALGVLVAGDGAVDATEWTFGDMPARESALRQAEALRADVLASVAAQKAADRTVRQAYAEYLPALGFLATPFYQTPGTALVPQTGWQGELALTLPIYDGGLRYGQEHERRARAEEARLKVEDTVRRARSEVRTAFKEVALADVALGQAEQSAAFAEKALALATAAYRGGATNNLDVIDAERRARDAATQAAIAEDAAREARLDLLAASGRFP